ncbi:MAG: hypothetical protein HUU22_00065 [Phycisphaerae bacterium]|nr:hypothetical protein [Phycisphaerae bacterium]NUQ44407.1 hypothetical protein [Phycisphaerae bacterium]
MNLRALRVSRTPLHRLWNDDEAAAAVEAAVVLAILCIGVIGAISALGSKSRDVWQFVADTLAQATGS